MFYEIDCFKYWIEFDVGKICYDDLSSTSIVYINQSCIQSMIPPRAFPMDWSYRRKERVYATILMRDWLLYHITPESFMKVKDNLLIQ